MSKQSDIDGTPKPVDSYDRAFQTRLEETLEDLMFWTTHSPLPAARKKDAYKQITEAFRETIQACKPDTYLLGCARHWSDDPSLPCTCDENERTAQSTADRYETALLEALND